MSLSSYTPDLDDYRAIFAAWFSDASLEIVMRDGMPVVLINNHANLRVPIHGLFPSAYSSRQDFIDTGNKVARALARGPRH